MSPAKPALLALASRPVTSLPCYAVLDMLRPAPPAAPLKPRQILVLLCLACLAKLAPPGFCPAMPRLLCSASTRLKKSDVTRIASPAMSSKQALHRLGCRSVLATSRQGVSALPHWAMPVGVSLAT